MQPNSEYDLSFYHYNAGAGNQTHVFYNGAIDPGNLIGTFVSSGSALNPATWVPNADFKLISNASGEIVVGITGGGNNVERIGINGISVTFAGTPPAPAPFEITAIDYVPGSGTVTLTWNSQPGEIFTVKFSTDMTNWDADLDDSIEADAGDTTTRAFNITGLDGGGGQLFFHVEK